ncbi:MAG: replication-relaxation family protein [Hyphomicrobiaceae bacterium]
MTELFHGGFLARPRAAYSFVRPGSEPLTYALGREGTRLLTDLDADFEIASPRKVRQATRGFLDHQLLVNELAISLRESHARSRPIAIGDDLLDTTGHSSTHPFRFSADVTLGTETRRIGIEPDLAFAIQSGERTYGYLVEIDRDTEPAVRSRQARGGRTPTLTGTSILRKLLGYAAIKRSGAVADRLGWRNFKVLFVCEPRPGGGDRIGRLTEVVKKHVPHQARLFMFASAAEMKQQDDILELDWRDANGNTVRLDPDRVTLQ